MIKIGTVESLSGSKALLSSYGWKKKRKKNYKKNLKGTIDILLISLYQDARSLSRADGFVGDQT